VPTEKKYPQPTYKWAIDLKKKVGRSSLDGWGGWWARTKNNVRNQHRGGSKRQQGGLHRTLETDELFTRKKKNPDEKLLRSKISNISRKNNDGKKRGDEKENRGLPETPKTRATARRMGGQETDALKS